MSRKREGIPMRCWQDVGISGNLSCPKLKDIVHCRNCADYNRAGRSLFDREIPDGFLEEWTRNLAVTKGVEAGQTVSLIVFRVRNEWLALKTTCLEEAAATRAVHHIPLRTNNIFKGLVNINGELLLCMSVAELLDYGKEGGDPRHEARVFERMLVVRIKGERYVFSADEILGIHRVPVADIGEPPSTMSKSPASLVTGIFDLEEKRVGVVDEDRLRKALKRSILP